MAEVVSSESDYEDLLGQWSDLESGLGIVLSSPASVQEFKRRVVQYARWMEGLMARDPDVGLYLLFQLAGNSPVGYSASHALVCATLCHVIAKELGTQTDERTSLEYAALTMNIAMTELQDRLANQVERPTPEQQELIQTHPVKGGALLTELGVADDLWLAIVSGHHQEIGIEAGMPSVPASVRMARILKVVDRYAAMISPRMSRAGRSATESARAVMANASAKADQIGHAMVQAVGMYPPGTFVRMDTGDLAIVVRRSNVLNMPYVAILGSADGKLLRTPKLHRPGTSGPAIRTALAAATVQANLNHFHILRLMAEQP